MSNSWAVLVAEPSFPRTLSGSAASSSTVLPSPPGQAKEFLALDLKVRAGPGQVWGSPGPITINGRAKEGRSEAGPGLDCGNTATTGTSLSWPITAAEHEAIKAKGGCYNCGRSPKDPDWKAHGGTVKT
ncbi:hypothetical protein K435DRAFT_872003 [Dendrothele bispora CBS 962.96]|uniref:Uncharacterized protein n=1 Tax=Dendrothele bispora (strain CBS 962.96) TaxID=1314807 RepID=A0A4S8L344_DENBC|nr:hypothetical protein K435DRAFT_872003 [Dendrothele bispora CBS 962.96]